MENPDKVSADAGIPYLQLEKSTDKNAKVNILLCAMPGCNSVFSILAPYVLRSFQGH